MYDCFDQIIGFEVHSLAWLGTTEGSQVERGGDQRDLEERLAYLGDRQRHAVHRDRTPGDDVFHQLRRRLDAQTPIAADRFNGANHAHAVDMTLDHVPPEQRRWGNRRLKIDRVADPKLAQRRQAERLMDDIETKQIIATSGFSVLGWGGDRQAAPVDRD